MTALAFQHGTHTLYSGACDRTVKLWNMTEQAYLDTVYGHQAPVHSIDALSRERCLTSGADRSVRGTGLGRGLVGHRSRSKRRR